MDHEWDMDCEKALNLMNEYSLFPCPCNLLIFEGSGLGEHGSEDRP